MYVLDTDHATLYQQAHPVLGRKLANLPFNEESARQFATLKRLRLKVGSQDLLIASIVLVHKATLLTRNSRHFSQVPGLLIEDWSVISS